MEPLNVIAAKFLKETFRAFFLQGMEKWVRITPRENGNNFIITLKTAVRHLQRLSQWVSESAYLALGRLAHLQGRTRSKVLEGLIMKEAQAVLDQEPSQ